MLGVSTTSWYRRPIAAGAAIAASRNRQGRSRTASGIVSRAGSTALLNHRIGSSRIASCAHAQDHIEPVARQQIEKLRRSLDAYLERNARMQRDELREQTLQQRLVEILHEADPYRPGKRFSGQRRDDAIVERQHLAREDQHVIALRR